VVSSVVMDNRSTADMASNMKVNMVQTETMAGADIVKMKMKVACREVSRADRKKITMTIIMMTMTIMVCMAGMEKKMTNMRMTRMKMTTVK
jgi:hypothetical protein